LAEAALNKKKPLFTRKLDLNLRKKLVKCCIWCYYIKSRGKIKSYTQYKERMQTGLVTFCIGNAF